MYLMLPRVMPLTVIQLFLRGVPLRLLRRYIATARSYSPATLFALTVALGQLLCWFLSPSLMLSTVMVLAFLLVVTARGFRGLLMGLLIGVFSCIVAIYCDSSAAPSRELVTIVQIEGEPRRTTPGRVVFKARDLLASDSPLLSCRALELPWRNSASLLQGDIVWLRGVAQGVQRESNPWSWQSWLWRRGVRYECKADFISTPIWREASAPFTIGREMVMKRVDRIAQERRGATLFLSMALGYHDLLSKPVEDAFTRLGLTHLLVVSGYQVSLVFGVVAACLAGLGAQILSGRFVRLAVMIAALGVALVYVLFIGAEMSATRAFVAAACVCLESLGEFGRRFAQRWGVALLVMQLIWPWAALEIGVQLTFAALAGIGVGMCLGRGSWIRSYLWINTAVWLFTSAVVVAWSGAVSFAGLILNLLLAAPWSFLNCTAGIVGLALSWLDLPLSSGPFLVVVWINELIAECLLLLSESALAGGKVEGVWQLVTCAALTLGSGLILLRAARQQSINAPLDLVR